MILIDTDNGLGSPSGDIDDGFAVAALIKAGMPIAGITTVAGNTTGDLSYRNTTHLCEVLGFSGHVTRPAEAGEVVRPFTGRIAALGPLTNVTGATRASEIVIVGGTLDTRGRWPPLWPYEFNLTFDGDAARRVFALDVPLTIFPIDVARGLWVHQKDLDPIGGPFGELARRESRRWFQHLFWLRQTGRFPIYDLAAAMYLIGTDDMTILDTVATMHENTFIEFGRGTRPVKVCTAVRREPLWRQFLQLFP